MLKNESVKPKRKHWKCWKKVHQIFLTERIYTPWNNQLAPDDITVEKEILDLEI